MVPIVLQHGLLGFGNFGVGKLRYSYFHRIDRAFEERGHPVITSQVHPTGSIVRRATQLRQTILDQLAAAGLRDEKVILFAHSMGGLDARYMISEMGMASHVRALVTLSTPHRGSPYADWCLRNLGHRLHGLSLARMLRLDVDALHDLTTERCARFNERVRDVPGVRYISISASRPWHRIAPMFIHSYRYIRAIEGDNDGLVSVTSAQWGDHRETWPADHLHVINKRLVIEIRNPTGDIVPRYLKVLDDLLDERRRGL